MISLGERGLPLQGARVHSEAAVSRSTTIRAVPRERSTPRSHRHCSWGRTGSSAAAPERSTGDRTATRPAGPEPPDRPGEPLGNQEARHSSPATDARTVGSGAVGSGGGGGAEQPPQRAIEVITQRRATRARRCRQRAHHHQSSSGQRRQSRPDQVPQPALHPVPGHGAADCPADHKTHLGAR